MKSARHLEAVLIYYFDKGGFIHGYVLRSCTLEGEKCGRDSQLVCGKLGGKVTFEGTFRGSPVRYVDIAGTNFIIYGALETDTAIIDESILPRYGVDHFGFQVDDIEAFLADMRAKNVRIIEGPIHVRKGVTIAYIEAPEKGRIEITQRD